jgi:hypothetical protein
VQGADDAKNRSLPQDLFAKILGAKLGIPVDPSSVKSMLQKGFGDDATKKVLGALGMAQGHIDKMAKGTGPGAKQAGMVSKILGMCLGGSGAGASAGAGAAGGAGAAAVRPSLSTVVLSCRLVVTSCALSRPGSVRPSYQVLCGVCSMFSTLPAHSSHNFSLIEWVHSRW